MRCLPLFIVAGRAGSLPFGGPPPKSAELTAAARDLVQIARDHASAIDWLGLRDGQGEQTDATRVLDDYLISALVQSGGELAAADSDPLPAQTDDSLEIIRRLPLIAQHHDIPPLWSPLGVFARVHLELFAVKICGKHTIPIHQNRLKTRLAVRKKIVQPTRRHRPVSYTHLTLPPIYSV